MNSHQKPRVIRAVKVMEGSVCIQFEDSPGGAWVVVGSPLDAISAHLQRELRMPVNCSHNAMLEALDINSATASRVRSGAAKFNEAWLVRAFDYSGISIEELRYVAGLEVSIGRHFNARVTP